MAGVVGIWQGSAGRSGTALVAAAPAAGPDGRVALALPPDEPRLARVLAVRVLYDPEVAEPGWIVLEGLRGSPEEASRRRVLPGSNRLLWELPEGFAGSRLTLLGAPPGVAWRVESARLLPRVGAGALAPLAGLFAALGLAAAVLLAGVARRPRCPSARVAALLGGILAAGTALRLYSLDAQGFWLDEILTVIGAQSLAWLLYTPQVFEHPPLQYLVVLVARGWSESETAVRMPFVAAGVAGIAATAWLGRALVGSGAGLAAAALVALSPFHIRYSQTARPYALVFLLAALALGALWRALEENRARAWLGFAAAASLLAYTHSLGLLAVALMAALALGKPARWAESALAFAIVGLLYLPWLPVAFRQWSLQHGAGEAGGIPTFVRSILLPELVGGERLVWIGGALALVGLGASWRRPGRLALFALWGGGPLLALWAMRPAHFLASRHLIFILPVFACLVGLGVVVLGRRAGSLAVRLRPGLVRAGTRSRRAFRWSHGAAAGLVFALSAVPSAAGLRGYYEERRGPDWREVARVLRETVQEHDRILATEEAYYPLRHYYGPGVETLAHGALEEARRARGPRQRLWVLYHADFGATTDLTAWLARHGRLVQAFPPSWSLRESRLYLIEAGHRSRAPRRGRP